VHTNVFLYISTALIILVLIVVFFRRPSIKNTNSNHVDNPGSDKESHSGAAENQIFPKLTHAHKQELIKLAREAIKIFVRSGEYFKFESQDPLLNFRLGVFVTLRKEEALRGCIGQLQSDAPLYQTVIDTAISSATRDPRFIPVSNQELDQISIEISILSPLAPVKDISEIEVGVHGVMIIHAGHRGILLPQVPVERGWDRTTFLENVCLKAGLHPDTWKENPQFFSFTTLEFGEE
jgi:AmmeMemoRadiSam system protein A